METIDEKVQAKINAGREYRKMEMRAADPALVTDGAKVVVGYATTFNQPYLLWKEPGFELWEQVDRNAFANTDMTDVIFQYDHEGRVFARISNGTLKVSPDNEGLYIEADLGGTEIGRQLYEEIKGGYTTKMSFGFTVAADRKETEEDADGNVKILRTVTDISKLWDVSAVSLPANDATVISSRNLGEGVIAEVKAERLKVEEEERNRKALIAKIKIEAER